MPQAAILPLLAEGGGVAAEGGLLAGGAEAGAAGGGMAEGGLGRFGGQALKMAGQNAAKPKPAQPGQRPKANLAADAERGHGILQAGQFRF